MARGEAAGVVRPFQTVSNRLMKAFEGKGLKTRRRYNAMFNLGFKSGAKARVEAGIAEPSGALPKRSARVPAKYTSRKERTLWAGGYRMGYAIGTPIAKIRTRRKTNT
jgi:hypothetical protein